MKTHNNIFKRHTRIVLLIMAVLCTTAWASGCAVFSDGKKGQAITYMNEKYGEIFMQVDDDIVVASTAPTDAYSSSAPDDDDDKYIYLQPTQHPKWRVAVLYDSSTKSFHDNYINFLLAARAANKMNNTILNLLPDSSTVYIIPKEPVDDSITKESMTQELLMSMPVNADIYTAKSPEDEAKDKEAIDKAIAYFSLAMNVKIHYLSAEDYKRAYGSGFKGFYEPTDKYYVSDTMIQGIRAEFADATSQTAATQGSTTLVASAEQNTEAVTVYDTDVTESPMAETPIESETETYTDPFLMDRMTTAETTTEPLTTTEATTTAVETTTQVPTGTVESTNAQLAQTTIAQSASEKSSGKNLVITSVVFYDDPSNHIPEQDITRGNIKYQLVGYKTIDVKGNTSSKPLEKAVTYNGVDASFKPPATEVVQVMNEATGQMEDVTLPLIRTEASAGASNVVFSFTLSAVSYGGDEYVIGNQVVSVNSSDPFGPLDSFLLSYFGYNDGKHRTANVHWVGEPRVEGDVTYRDAAGDIVQGANSVTAIYGASYATTTSGGKAIEATYREVE